MEGIKVVLKKVEENIIVLANRNNLYQFIRTYPCLPTPSRPDTFIKFSLANVSKPPLTNSLSLLKSST